jgi:hypothetical protein
MNDCNRDRPTIGALHEHRSIEGVRSIAQAAVSRLTAQRIILMIERADVLRAPVPRTR